MTRVRVESFTISLDGYGAGPGQDINNPLGVGGTDLHQWAFPTRTFQRALFGADGDATGIDNDFAERGFKNVGAWILGRNMFGPIRDPCEIFASYWPHHEDDWPGINKVAKYVASNTLSRHEWNNSIFLNGNITDQIRKLKQQDGPDLQVHGSGNLIQTLLKHDLVDELWLKIFPITLGAGKRLFAEGAVPAAFTLHDSKASPKGVIVANYKRAGEVQTGSF